MRKVRIVTFIGLALTILILISIIAGQHKKLQRHESRAQEITLLEYRQKENAKALQELQSRRHMSDSLSIINTKHAYDENIRLLDNASDSMLKQITLAITADTNRFNLLHD